MFTSFFCDHMFTSIKKLYKYNVKLMSREKRFVNPSSVNGRRRKSCITLPILASRLLVIQ